MAFSLSGKIEIFYEVHGQGAPLLLISGLGGGSWSWFGQVPFFRNHYRTITFDNRGAGRSSKPPGPYTMMELARDAAGILDHLDIPSASVMGLSMGGMIAQELALLAPERVRALVLGCTHCGGSEKIAPDPDVIARFAANTGLSQAQIIDKNLPFLFSETFLEEHPDRVAAYRKVQLNAPLQPEHAFQAQLQAIQTFSACDRLPGLRIPTLVVTGTEDALVPAENARILERLIPGARRLEFQGAGHALHVECRDRLNEAAHTFFLEHAS